MIQPTTPLGSFELGALLGRGGMAEVWRGEHVGRGVPVAIKVLSANKASLGSIQRRFVREVRAQARLDHPGIATVLDHGIVDDAAAEASNGKLTAGSLYLVMELIENGSLKDHEPPSDWVTLHNILKEILEALAHAHARDVIHRDIKPGNILVAKDLDGTGRLKLTDFGIAFAMHDRELPTSEKLRVAGSVRYMAPEQLLGQWRDQGPWTDLYALGCMAYLLATGFAPFEGKGTLLEMANRHLHRQVPSPRCLFPSPPGFAPWLMKLMAKSPEDRFRLAADALHALATLDDLSWLPTSLTSTAQDDDQLVTSVAPRSPRPMELFPRDWRISEEARHRLTPQPPPLGFGLGLYGLRTIPLADRYLQRDALWQALQQVSERGRARLVLLNGDAGVGKSRLVEWLCERAHELGLAHRVRALHDLEQGPHTGLRGLVEDLLKVDGLEREQALERVKHLFHRRGIKEPYWWLSLTAIASPDPSPMHTEKGKPHGGFRFRDNQERYQAVGFLIRELCQERPVIAWLDDVQWGPDALRFVQFMMHTQSSDPCPVLFVMTLRDTDLHPDTAALIDELTADAAADQIVLSPLEMTDQRQLVSTLLGLDSQLIELVLECTEGNPLFAIQLVGDWVQRSLLSPGPAGFQLSRDATIVLPEHLHALWRQRLDLLLSDDDGQHRIALELAATLGNSVNEAEWLEVCQLQGCSPHAQLVASLLSERLAKETDTGWCFIHNLFQASLLEQAKRVGRLNEHHRICAAMLQVRFGLSGHRGLLERIGNHLMLAEDHDTASGVLLQAAEERIFGGDFALAQTLHHRWRLCMEASRANPREPAWAKGALIQAQILRRLGQYQDAFLVLEGLPPSLIVDDESLAKHLVERARTLSALGRVREDSSSFEQANSLHDQAAALYRKLDSSAGLLEVMLSQAITLTMIGAWNDAASHYLDALEISEELDDELQTAMALVGLSEIDREQGRIDDSWNKGQRALDIFERLGARYHICQALYNLADIDRIKGHMTDAEDRYRRILNFMEGLGSFNGHLVRFALAQILIARKAHADALDLLESILAALNDLGPASWLQTVRCHTLVCAAAIGHRELTNQQLANLNTLLISLDDVALLKRAAELFLDADDSALSAVILRLARAVYAHHKLPHQASALHSTIEQLEGLMDIDGSGDR